MYRRVYPGDIVYNTMRMWQGASARSDYFGIVSPAYTVCQPVDPSASQYLAYALKLPEHVALFRRRSQGITSDVWNLRFDELQKIRIPIVNDISSQRRIADILSTIDQAVEHTEVLIAKMQKIKAGLMHDLFTRGVLPSGRLRPRREEAPHLYKESSLGWIPKEWDTGGLADKRVPGVQHLKTGPFGSSLKLEHWVDEGRPVITIGAVGDGYFIESELLRVSEETAELLHDYQLQVGDVVFSRVADVGRSAAVGSAQEGWIMSSNLMRISLDRKQVVSNFLQAELGYDARIRLQTRAKVNAGGRNVANSEILNTLEFLWAPIAEQERIVECVTKVEASRQLNIVLVDKLKMMKLGLMHDLLTRRVRVPVPETATGATEA